MGNSGLVKQVGRKFLLRLKKLWEKKRGTGAHGQNRGLAHGDRSCGLHEVAILHAGLGKDNGGQVFGDGFCLWPFAGVDELIGARHKGRAEDDDLSQKRGRS